MYTATEVAEMEALTVFVQPDEDGDKQFTAEAVAVELGLATELLWCEAHGKLAGVMQTFLTNPADPTVVYVLSCGHRII